MTFFEKILDKKRLIMSIALLLSLLGTIMWFQMIRQEDPSMDDYWGMIVTPYPGADASTVEKLILDPLEDALAEIHEINWMESTAFDEVAVINIELKGDIYDFNLVWQDVRDTLEGAAKSFPSGAGKPVLDDEMQDQDSVVLAVTGSSDLLVLLKTARDIKDKLIKLPQVSKVHLICDPKEQITIDLDDATANRIGINADTLAFQLGMRNKILPGGSLKVGEKTVRLKPLSEFSDMDEIKNTPVLLPSGNSVPLSTIARVHKGPSEPFSSKMRYNGEMSIGVAIVPVKGINLVKFGDTIKDKLADLEKFVTPLKLHTVAFQPKRTKARIGELSQSLLFGVLIVAGILILSMGLRLGLLVAAVVPLVTMTSLLLFAWGGGVLHQISIAAMVLSLGMLVDNAIVMAESIQYRLDKGEPSQKAVIGAVKELYIPLAAATLTTLAAFVPMLIAKGPTAMFTRSIPVMIMLALSVSYFYAIFVTPLIGQIFLKKREKVSVENMASLGKKISQISVDRPVIVVCAALLLVMTSFAASSMVKQQFFPTSDRNQFVIDLKLTEGAHLDATDKASRMIENTLLSKQEVTKVSSYIGRSAPQFYYNIMSVPFSPHFAQLLIETTHKKDIESLLSFIRKYVKNNIPHGEIVARKLEQGPPVGAPVEIRLYGDSFDALDQAAILVARTLRNIEGTEDIRHNLGPGAPTLEFRINDAESGRYGLSRADIAKALYGRTRGIPIGELHETDDPVPVLIRSSQGERMPVESLSSIYVPAREGRLIPLSQVATIETFYRPAAIRHRNATRTITVSSQLAEGFTFSEILAELDKQLPTLPIPAGIDMSFGGDKEGSGEANTALLKSIPIGFILLFIVLIAEFNSFRRLFIILSTIPLAASGVIPGLLIGNQPFGFMSLLGVIALVGIVVNNAIVLLDVVEEQRKNGSSIRDALVEAVSRRTRPIVLTMATTVAGLLPLAFSSSTLWPPLAWAMISGLLASTVLTLVVVPSLYRILFIKDKRKLFAVPRRFTQAASFIIIFFIWVPFLSAEDKSLTLKEVMEKAKDRPAVKSSELMAEASEKAFEAEKRSAYLPILTTQAAYSVRDRDVDTIADFNGFSFANSIGDRRHYSANIMIVQPIFNPSRNLFLIPASADEAASKKLLAQRKKQEVSAEAAHIYLNVLALDAQISATESFVKSLGERLKEMKKMVEVGRVLETDVLKIVLSFEQAQQDLFELKNYRAIVRKDLARSISSSIAIEPLPITDMSEKIPPVLEDARKKALEKRIDLAALKLSIKALSLRCAGVKADFMPKFQAVGKWIWDDGMSSTSEDNWFEGSLNISWTPLSSGARFSKTSELNAQIRAMKNDLTEIIRGISLEIQSKIIDIDNAKGAFKVERRGVEHAAETLRVESARHREGRATTNDLLDAETQLRERRTHFEISKIDIVRAWIELWLCTGNDAYFFE